MPVVVQAVHRREVAGRAEDEAEHGEHQRPGRDRPPRPEVPPGASGSSPFEAITVRPLDQATTTPKTRSPTEISTNRIWLSVAFGSSKASDGIPIVFWTTSSPMHGGRDARREGEEAADAGVIGPQPEDPPARPRSRPSGR